MPTYPALSRKPSYPLTPNGEIEDVILTSPKEAGYEQTRPRTTRVRRSFGVNYVDLPNVDVALLRTFESTTLRNGADAFTWTHPLTGTSYTVRLQGPIRFSQVKGHTSENVSFMLREV